MNQVELIVQLHQRLRRSQKEVATVTEVGKKVADHFRLGDAVKVNQYVAAENQIHALHEEHLGIILQVQAAERNELLHLGAHLQFLVIEGSEILAFVEIAGIAQRVVAVYAGLCRFHGAVVQIGSQDLHGPALQQI